MNKQQILLVDDSKFARSRVADMLTKGGHSVVQAADGVEALECLSREPCPIVLCDIEMPRMGGLEFLREVRSRSEHANIKVVMLTASSRKNEIEQARAGGADGWLVKPMQPPTLLSMIARYTA